MSRTVGISPKVYIPALAELATGIAFLIAGLDVEGRTAIAAAFGVLAVGYGASPGTVTHGPDGPDSPDADTGARAS